MSRCVCRSLVPSLADGRDQGFSENTLCFRVARWLIQMLGLQRQGEMCSNNFTKDLPGAVSSARPSFTTQAV